MVQAYRCTASTLSVWAAIRASNAHAVLTAWLLQQQQHLAESAHTHTPPHAVTVACYVVPFLLVAQVLACEAGEVALSPAAIVVLLGHQKLDGPAKQQQQRTTLLSEEGGAVDSSNEMRHSLLNGPRLWRGAACHQSLHTKPGAIREADGPASIPAHTPPHSHVSVHRPLPQLQVHSASRPLTRSHHCAAQQRQSARLA